MPPKKTTKKKPLDKEKEVTGALFEPDTDTLDEQATKDSAEAFAKREEERAIADEEDKQLPVVCKDIAVYTEKYQQALLPYMDVSPLDIYYGIPHALDLVHKLRSLPADVVKEVIIYYLSHWETPKEMIKEVRKTNDDGSKGQLLYYYVPGHYFKKILTAFFPGEWWFRDLIYKHEKETREAIVQGTFVLRWPTGEEQEWPGIVGKCNVRDKMGLGNAMKGAYKDLYKRAANIVLGLADDVYSGKYASDQKHLTFDDWKDSRTLSKKQPFKHFFAILRELQIPFNKNNKSENGSVYWILANSRNCDPETISIAEIHRESKLQKALDIVWKWKDSWNKDKEEQQTKEETE